MTQALGEQDVLKYNALVLASRVPQDVAMQVGKLVGTFQTEAADELRRQQLALNEDFFKEEGEGPKEKPKAKSAIPKDDGSQKALKSYRALQKTEAIRLLKEEVLLAQDHTCLACEIKVFTRSEHEKITDSPYPLIVRCVFPPHKYIQAKGLFDPKTACRDPKLLNPDYYVALCTDCKPLGFGRK